ncbi:hypothetical protein LIA77_03316 [Sarocladium implicatum]|jgi:hypothetical protein|nr:hypothetical protein LIA77_03316 [Sarocladium implicatum]
MSNECVISRADRISRAEEEVIRARCKMLKLKRSAVLSLVHGAARETGIGRKARVGRSIGALVGDGWDEHVF